MHVTNARMHVTVARTRICACCCRTERRARFMTTSFVPTVRVFRVCLRYPYPIFERTNELKTRNIHETQDYLPRGVQSINSKLDNLCKI